jgi:outer membrane protein OmpA-like peptidoglycan-associated protein
LRVIPGLVLVLAAAPALAQAPSGAGTAVNWQALDQAAPPGVTVDWGALNGGAGRAAPGAETPSATAPVILTPPAVMLKPPPEPKREVAVVPPPKPPQRPVAPTAPTHAIPVAAPAIVAPAPVPAPGAARPVPAAAPATLPGKPAVVQFAKGEIELPPAARATLDRLAAAMGADGTLRLVIDAHASGDPGDPVAARRVSLQRAVAMRSYLIDKGVAGMRMDVRALGDTAGGDGPIDRVDLSLVAR